LPLPARGGGGRRRGAAGGSGRRRCTGVGAGGRRPLLPRPCRARIDRGGAEWRRWQRRRRILRGNRSGAFSRVPRLQSTALGGPAIPRKTERAIERSELLA